MINNFISNHYNKIRYIPTLISLAMIVFSIAGLPVISMVLIGVLVVFLMMQVCFLEKKLNEDGGLIIYADEVEND